GLRGYSGKIRRYLGRKQLKTCVWVSAVEGRAFLQRPQNATAYKLKRNTLFRYARHKNLDRYKTNRH
ncbi:hypothetical protein DC320_10415, partial [Neisseria gonorrhoeae]